MKVEDDNEATSRLEAALYSAGRPLTVEEMIKASGTESRTKTLAIIATIEKKTKAAFRAIEIATLPDGSYVMQLKPEMNDTVRKFASRPILAKATLKTLSYIAYMQPISSKHLVETRGSGVYSHLKELEQLEFISHQNVGRLKIFTTTSKFQKYFGISGDTDILKQILFKKRKTTTPPQPITQQA